MPKQPALAKPTMLWVAVTFGDYLRTGPTTTKEAFVWDTGVRRLQVSCFDGNGASYAEARFRESSRSKEERKRLLFCQNNDVGQFRVRVYRKPVSMGQAREDFARQVEPAKPQGMA